MNFIALFFAADSKFEMRKDETLMIPVDQIGHCSNTTLGFSKESAIYCEYGNKTSQNNISIRNSNSLIDGTLT